MFLSGVADLMEYERVNAAFGLTIACAVIRAELAGNVAHKPGV